MSRSKCHLCFSPEILTWRPRTEEKNQKKLRCHSDSGFCTFRLCQSTLQFSASCLVYWSHWWPNWSTGTGPVLISCESYCHLVVSGTPWSINQCHPCVCGWRQQLWSSSKYRVGAFGWEKSAKTAWIQKNRSCRAPVKVRPSTVLMSDSGVWEWGGQGPAADAPATHS